MKLNKAAQKLEDEITNATECEKCFKEKDVLFKMPRPLKIEEFTCYTPNDIICFDCFSDEIELIKAMNEDNREQMKKEEENEHFK